MARVRQRAAQRTVARSRVADRRRRPPPRRTSSRIGASTGGVAAPSGRSSTGCRKACRRSSATIHMPEKYTGRFARPAGRASAGKTSPRRATAKQIEKRGQIRIAPGGRHHARHPGNGSQLCRRVLSRRRAAVSGHQAHLSTSPSSPSRKPPARALLGVHPDRNGPRRRAGSGLLKMRKAGVDLPRRSRKLLRRLRHAEGGPRGRRSERRARSRENPGSRLVELVSGAHTCVRDSAGRDKYWERQSSVSLSRELRSDLEMPKAKEL